MLQLTRRYTQYIQHIESSLPADVSSDVMPRRQQRHGRTYAKEIRATPVFTLLGGRAAGGGVTVARL